MDDLQAPVFRRGVLTLLMNMTGLFDNRNRFETFKEKGVQLLVPQGRVTYLSRSGEKTQSPMFQSIYVCRDILPHDIEFVGMTKE